MANYNDYTGRLVFLSSWEAAAPDPKKPQNKTANLDENKNNMNTCN